MIKIRFHIALNNIYGSGVEEVFEYPDDVTDEELEKDFTEWVWEEIDAGWNKEGGGE